MPDCFAQGAVVSGGAPRAVLIVDAADPEPADLDGSLLGRGACGDDELGVRTVVETQEGFVPSARGFLIGGPVGFSVLAVLEG